MLVLLRAAPTLFAVAVALSKRQTLMASRRRATSATNALNAPMPAGPTLEATVSASAKAAGQERTTQKTVKHVSSVRQADSVQRVDLLLKVLDRVIIALPAHSVPLVPASAHSAVRTPILVLDGRLAPCVRLALSPSKVQPVAVSTRKAQSKFNWIWTGARSISKRCSG